MLVVWRWVRKVLREASAAWKALRKGGVGLAVGEVARGLLGPGYGLEVGAVEARGAGGVGGAVGPKAGGPVF